VVRAAAASAIPLISAVGHETDTTLIDFAADRRAPTPTAAAEMAVPVRADLVAWTAEQEARLARAAARAIADRRQRLRDLARALPRPEALLDTPRQRLDRWGERLPAALRARVQRARVRLAEAPLRPDTLQRFLGVERRRLAERGARLSGALVRLVAQRRRDFRTVAPRLARGPLDRARMRQAQLLADRWQRLGLSAQGRLAGLRARLEAAARLLGSLGYEATLERGFAVVRAGGRVVTTRAEAAPAPALEIQFRDGRIAVRPAGVAADAGGDAPRRPGEGQGSLS
jgi:exodeoxyribonuclease VII large subunit